MKRLLLPVLLFLTGASFDCLAVPLQLIVPRDVMARSHNEQGISFARKGTYDRALAEFDDALALSPDFVRALFNRGLVYLQMGRYDQAIVDFDKVIEIGDRNTSTWIIREATHVPKELYAQVYFYRGAAYLSKAEYDLSIINFTKALEIDHKFARAFNGRGAAY